MRRFSQVLIIMLAVVILLRCVSAQQHDSTPSPFMPPERAFVPPPRVKRIQIQNREDAQLKQTKQWQADPTESKESPSQNAALNTEKSEASNEETSTSEDIPTIEQIKITIEEIGASETIEGDKKAEYLEYLINAVKRLEAAKQYQQKQAKLKTEIKQAPGLLAAAKKKLEEQIADIQPEVASGMKLNDLEQALRMAEEEHKSAQDEFSKCEQRVDSKFQTDRIAEIGKLKEDTKVRLQEIEDELKVLAGADESDASVFANKLELKARRHSEQHHLELIEVERKHSEALRELFVVQRDLAHRKFSQSEKLATAWQDIVAHFRKEESDRQAAEARRKASEAHPAVRGLAESNTELAESRSTLTRKMDLVANYLESARGEYKRVDEDYSQLMDKVEVHDMTPTIGLLLRDRRSRLPNLRFHKERIEFSKTEMQNAQIALLDLEGERTKLGDFEKTIDTTISELGSKVSQIDPEYLDKIVRQQLETRREYLDSLLLDYHNFHDDLSNLELATRELIDKTETYRSFIDENVLWIPSAPRIGKSAILDSRLALTSFVAGESWLEVGSSTSRNTLKHPWASAGLVLACISLFVFRRRIHNSLRRIGDQVAAEKGLTFLPTLRAFVLTVMLAALWPLMLWCIGWWMSLDSSAPQLALSLATGFKSTAAIYFVIELFRQICRPHGLANEHFEWQMASVEVAYRSLGWLIAFTLPTSFLVAVLGQHNEGELKDTLGRTVLLCGLGLLAFYLHWTMRPWNGPLPNAWKENTKSWFYRLRHFSYLAAIGLPISLGVLLALGYTYSADQIMSRLWLAACLFLGLVLVQELVARALLVAWNRIQHVRTEVPQASGQSNRGTESLEDVAVDDHAKAFEDVDKQLTQLARAGALLAFVVANWFIWSDVLPALQILDRVTLWSTTMQVAQDVQSADGTKIAERVTKEVPVTLADLIVCLMALTATYVAAKTLPGLLEVSVLGRLPLNNGARHATVIISRYIVTLIGFILACRSIGISWSSVQWLAAAMTVGLGFGLQEIFANFISGLIILFERPIRIGDLVTVSNVTGKVTRMQIRATTITDFDRRELIVPNKRFITDEVINWTLSDPITRLVIPIGISYDSDPSKAHDLLLKTARLNPHILREPAPSAVFLEFGDSTLNLELRVFLGHREELPSIQHELNLAIERSFREAEIEIAFPQQDIHIRSVGGVLPFATAGPPKDNRQAEVTQNLHKAA